MLHEAEGKMMSIIQLLGAFGIGIIITKLLDILWLERVMQESEKKKWLRDKRLKVFSDLTKELLSIGTYKKSYDSLYEGYIFMSEAILLVKDEKLADKIEKFFQRLSVLGDKTHKEASTDEIKEGEAIFKELFIESRKIVQELRLSLLNN